MLQRTHERVQAADAERPRPGQELHAAPRGAPERGPWPVAGHSFSRVAVPAAATIQFQLSVAPPDDRFEQEADAAAEQVLRMPAGSAPPSLSQLWGSEVQRAPVDAPDDDEEEQDEDETEEAELLQPKTAQGAAPPVGPQLAARIQGMRGGGAPLADGERGFFEPRFGHRFADVRVHHAGAAAGIARQLHARAFTVGSDIFFGQSEFAPHTAAGSALLAHELAHVVQQRGGEHDRLQRQRRRRSRRSSRGRPSTSTPITSISFNGSRVTVYGGGSVSFPAVSGLMANHPTARGVDYTRPRYQDLPDKGPIPAGSYFIRPAEAETARAGGFNTTAWGHYRVPLHESFFTELSRRLFTERTGGFFLHQDANHNGTAGCIGLVNHADNRYIYLRLRASENEIPVTVSYP